MNQSCGEKIGVLGGGSWGAALADHLALNGHDVAVWEYNAQIAERLERERTLATLPSFKLHDSVRVTNDVAQALKGRPLVLSVTPSHTVRSTFQHAVERGAVEKGAVVVSATKGLERKSHATMSQIIRDTAPGVGEVVILSGPSHAEEVASKLPVALVSASTSRQQAERTQKIFSSETVRVYTSDDPLGVELGGSLKNIYAVACGIIDGLAMGDNTKAALMTRGLHEMSRIGIRMGAQTLTFFGLSGLGDLIVTCGSRHSRNRLVGEKIGSGKTLSQALAEMTMVAEGVNTTESVYELARIKDVEMPIVNEMHKVLFENKSPRESIKDLLARGMRAETEGLIL